MSLYERQRSHGGPGAGTPTGPPVRSVPDRDRPRRSSPESPPPPMTTCCAARSAAQFCCGSRTATSEGDRRGGRRVPRQSRTCGIRLGGVVGRPQHGAGREQAGDRACHQQCRRVPRPDRRPGGGGQAGRHRGRGAAWIRSWWWSRCPAAGRSSIPTSERCIKQAKAVDARFDRISYAWIPRAENSHADRLANEAMDAAAELEKPSPRRTRQRPPKHRPRPPAGPAPAARRPDFCCCGTGRPNCPRSDGIPVVGTRR